jgi:uncharacterized membrane protein HdeD (DUF308 family)
VHGDQHGQDREGALRAGGRVVAVGVDRRVVDLWWLMMIVGIIEILLGVWAMGYPGRSAALLIFWIGFGAVIRGVMAIAMAFMARHIPEEVAA